MAFKFKVAYTVDPAKIQPSLDAGVIDAGDLVIVNDNGVGKLCFITDTNAILEMSGGITDSTQLETIVTQVVSNQVQDIVDSAVEEAMKNQEEKTWEDF